MATATQAAPAEDTEAKGGKKKLIIIVVVAAVVVLAAVGGALFFLLGSKSDSSADAKKDDGSVVITMADDTTLNLADGHFLKTKLGLKLTKEGADAAGGADKAAKSFDGSMAKDAAIQIYGKYTMQQLLKPEIKAKAQKDLVTEVGKRYDGKVTDVYLTDFVMQ